MFESIDGIDPLSPVQLEQLRQQRDHDRSLFSESPHQSARAGFELFDSFAARQGAPSGHALFGGSANKIKDHLDLVKVAVSGQDRLSQEHLAEDAADAPHIDCRRVLTKLKKQLGRPVPTRHDQTRVIPRGHAVAISGLWGWLFELACQTKIRYLQISTVVDQKIGGFHVPMQDLIIMQILQPLQQLHHIALNLRGGEVHIRIFEKAGQVVVHVWRDHVHDGFLSPFTFAPFDGHLLQCQDVGMREHFQQSYLADGGDWQPILLVVE